MAKRGFGQLFARKSVEQMHAEHEHGELKRSLGASNLVLLGIGCIIGTGIFVLTGRAAAQFAGPAIMISFIITGTLCTLVALAYAELASAIPVSGSAYSYSYASMGEVVAWIMGLLLGPRIRSRRIDRGRGLVGLRDELPARPRLRLAGRFARRARNGDHRFHDGSVVGTGAVNLPAVIAIGAVTGLLVLGVSESAIVNNVVVAIKVSVVVAFIVIGAFYVNPDLWTPLIPPQQPPPPAGESVEHLERDRRRALGRRHGAEHGPVRRSAASSPRAATIFFAYIGFEAVSTAGAESKNPARDMPIGILGSLIICTILYILTSAVLVGIVPYTRLNDPAPIARPSTRSGCRGSRVLVKIGAIAGLSSVMLVLLYGQTRIFYTMARDGLIPPVFARVHPKFKTPWINTLLVGRARAAVSRASWGSMRSRTSPMSARWLRSRSSASR